MIANPLENRKAYFRYLFGVAMVVLAFELRLLLIPLTGTGAPFVLFFGAVLVTSLFAGPGPGLCTLVLSVPVAAYMFVFRAGFPRSQAMFQTALYAVDGVLIVYLTTLAGRANRALRRANEERQIFVSVIENSSDFIGIADATGKPVYVNPAGREMVGLPADHPVDQTQITDYYPPEQRGFARDVILASMMERGQWSGETFFRNWQTNAVIPVSDEHFVIRDERNGHIVAMATITRDISEARRIHEQLRESEERFRLAIDEAPIGMALVALDGRFVRVNRALCEITGYTADELTTLTFQAITHPDDANADLALADRLARGEISRYQLEKRYVRKDGSLVDILLNRSVLRSADRAPLYFITQMEDITDRKCVEESLRQAVAAREHVLRVVAHDLRNPLSTIMLQARAPEVDPRARNVILRAATRMNHLIQDLLDVALMEAGQLAITRTRVTVDQLVSQAVDTQIPLVTAAGLQICVEVDRAAAQVWADRDRLLQVLENLIGNAVKFTPAGGRVAVGAVAKHDDVVFWVTDSGCGIAREELSRVFDRFWQAQRGSRRGAGLGLPIAKGIVEAHGGQIWAESTVGRGTTFWFSIPKAVPVEDRPADVLH